MSNKLSLQNESYLQDLQAEKEVLPVIKNRLNECNYSLGELGGKIDKLEKRLAGSILSYIQSSRIGE